ncbi:MAG: tetratricopeptide repeat protein [Deltaproteobacteria bacterium]|nr:tetratricopeptide repeat protein [Deltaproteobacteria bacterium]MBM4284624.1 tetratricopeptide repeat protein [Deltaproteobacteria bacterium]
MERRYGGGAEPPVKRRFPRRALTLLVLGVALGLASPLAAADCDQARNLFRQALDLDFGVENILKKEQLYRRAVELCPTYVEAHNNLGDVYEHQGRFDEAIAQYKEAVRLKPEAPEPYLGLGDVYFKTNRHEEARRWYEEGRKRGGQDPETARRSKLAADISRGGVIKADTIRAALEKTRGRAEVVSITIGQGLIPFDYDKAELKPEAKPQLDEVGKALKALLEGSRDIVTVGTAPSSLAFEIAGHTDVRGSDVYNLDLSRRRVEAVVAYLVQHFAIPRARLIPRGYGKRRVLCPGGADEGCHALNRRVEIVRTESVREGGEVRTRSAGAKVEKSVKIEAGFFYLAQGRDIVQVLTEDSRLRSRQDKYFVFFRPRQDCYVHILQEDGAGKLDLLFPQAGGSAKVLAGRDYWLPAFGRAFTLDDVKGEEKLYLLASAHSLETALAGLPLAQQVRSAVAAYRTRALQIVRPEGALEAVPAAQVTGSPQAPQKLKPLLEQLSGEGAWVRVAAFQHE